MTSTADGLTYHLMSISDKTLVNH